MPNPKISTITLPSGTTYDIKDASVAGGNAWYGTCPTGASAAEKVVTTETGDFRLEEGSIVFIKFTNGNTSTSATLKVDNAAATSFKQYGTTAPVSGGWAAGAVVGFVFDGTNFLQIDGSTATTSVYGITKLTDSTTSTSTTTAATPKSVKDALDAAKAYTDATVTGATAFQGTVDSGSDISGLDNYTQGYYWVVATPGTYVGEQCEVGDFIFCTSSKDGAYSADDFSVVQANIDMSVFGDLAYKDTASATYTPAGTVSQPTFSGTSGSVSVTTSGAVTAVTGSVDTTSTNGVDIKPAGTVSTPTITVTPATGTVNSITDVGTSPSWTATVANENLTIGWSAGTLPTKGDDTSVVTGITSATATQPTFTGTQKYLHISTTKDTVTSTGSFTPSGTVTQPAFTGTEETITVS